MFHSARKDAHRSSSSRYLYEFLFGWIISALTRADSFLFEQECISEQYKNLSRGQKKSKLKKKKMKPYGRDLMNTQALQVGVVAFVEIDPI